MLKPFFLIGSTAFWLYMMSRLFQMEFFQFIPVRAAYEVMPFHEYGVRDDYHAVYLGKQRIGFTYNALDRLEKPKDGQPFELRHSSYLSFLLLGQKSDMLAKGTALLDENLHLKSFALRVSSKDYWHNIQGQTAGQNMNLVIEGKDSPPVRKIIPFDGDLYYSESLDYLWTANNLQTGRRGTIKLWNPIVMNFEQIEFRVGEKTSVTTWDESGEHPVETFIIYIGPEGGELRTWVTLEGVVIQKESPTGLLIKREPGWEIFKALREKGHELPDLPHLYSIPADRPLEHPDRLERTVVKLVFQGNEKTVETLKKDLDSAIRSAPSLGDVPETAKPYLAANEWIQAQDPAMVEEAKKIVGDEKNSVKAALKIMRWVHEIMEPVPTVSVPSATQVLSVRKGDCNEYTVLFTALARAAGIPTRMTAGLVYQSGRFFYHAWPEIYTHEWIGLDPTFNQAPTGALHVPVVQGEVQEQVKFLGQIGKIKLQIIEATQASGSDA